MAFEIKKAVLQAGDKVVATVRKSGSDLYTSLKVDANLFVVEMEVTRELLILFMGLNQATLQSWQQCWLNKLGHTENPPLHPPMGKDAINNYNTYGKALV